MNVFYNIDKQTRYTKQVRIYNCTEPILIKFDRGVVKD